MSLENPFSKKPILPPEETNPDSNIELIGALLGPDSAEAYRKTIAGEISRPVAQKPDFKLDNFDEEVFGKHNQVEQGEAEILFGEKFIGPKDFQETFGFTPENVPSIPFSREDLKDAQEKGLTLCLNWDTLPDGTKLSVQKMIEILGNKQKDGNRLVRVHSPVFVEEPTYIMEVPRRGWVLASNEVKYKNQDYLMQIDSLIAECPNTEIYRQAIEEYEENKSFIQDCGEDWEKGVLILSNLRIIELTRDSFSERFQYMILSNQKTGIKIHGNENYWTRSYSAHGSFLFCGEFNMNGIYTTTGQFPIHSRDNLGVSFSRRV